MFQNQSLNQPFKIVLLLLLLFTQFLHSQTSSLILSWDKQGCQPNDISKIALNDFANTCMKVCKNSIMTYMISGEDYQNIDTIKWTVVGGKLGLTDKQSTPIEWDETSYGSIKLEILLTNGTNIIKTLCVQKAIPSITLSWDKTGCQVDKDNVNEIKLENIYSNSPCLKVCKDITTLYKISGESVENIASIEWTIVGGSPEFSNELSIPIKWTNSLWGSIKVHILFNNGNVVERTICVNKIDSTLLLDWEKIDENSVRQIKFDNSPDNSNAIIVYTQSTVLYKLDGKGFDNVESVNWSVVGGYAYTPNQPSTYITWDEAIENIIQITVLYKDGSSITRTINIVSKAPPGGGENAPNSIKFSYDDVGNQIKREIIYLARQSNPDAATIDSSRSTNFKKSEEYPTISYYPNPVKYELNIKWSEKKSDEIKLIELYDITGKLIDSFANKIIDGHATINFENYPLGLYNLVLISNNGESKTLKIIKQ